MKPPSAAAAAAEIILILERQPADRRARVWQLLEELLALDRRRIPIVNGARSRSVNTAAPSTGVNAVAGDGTRGTVERIMRGAPR
jgi:hypothetical protein